MLESGSGQAVTLAADATLAANGFYRGMETGGASGYTISGGDMETSVFDFSGNDCGMALSYFDSNATFEHCKLEVSNCLSSGIFMRQDNAALDGLFIDHVDINCVNNQISSQKDIAVRFHSNDFKITNSNIYIEDAWNTSLWLFDGWNDRDYNLIDNCTITINKVNHNAELYGAIVRSKGVTFNPIGKWTISDCTFNLANCGQGGINIASNIQLSYESLLNPDTWRATPTVYGGKITLEDTEVNTEGIIGADIGVQVGQFLEIGKNVVVNNGGAEDHFTVLCDNLENKFPASILGAYIGIQYGVPNGMTDAQKAAKRVTVSGGSYWSTRNEELEFLGEEECKFFEESVPVNEAGEAIQMFTVEQDAFAQYATDRAISLIMHNADGEESSYTYEVANASADGKRYIWAPTATVTFIRSDQTTSTVVVPRGAAFGLTAELPEGAWECESVAFTAGSMVNGDITVTAA